MKLVLTSVTFLAIIATPTWGQTYNPNIGRAKKISNFSQYESSGHQRSRYKHGYFYEHYLQTPYYGFGGYFRPFGGSYGGYYGGYFGSGNYFGSPYNPCGLGRSVLEGCRPYRGY